MKKMKTKTINLYQFEELSETAKEKALNNHNENCEYFGLNDNLNELLNCLLDEHKIKALNKTELFYSLSHCQGDGVCFVGDFQYLGFNFYIRHQGHYYHSKSVNIELEDNTENEFDDHLKEDVLTAVKEDIEEKFNLLYEQICRKIEESGYEEIEYLLSEECFKEDCEANDFMFREDGTLEFY